MHRVCSIVPRPVSPQAWLLLHAGAGVACLIMADWLFFAHAVGVSLAVFLLFVALVCAVVNPVRATARAGKRAWAILAAGLAAVVYDCNFLSACFGVAALSVCCQMLGGASLSRWPDRLKQGRRMLLAGYVWLPRDVVRVMLLWRARRSRKPVYERLLVWVVPLLFGAVFAVLFAAANPLLADAWDLIDLYAPWRAVSLGRLCFWLFILGLIWPYLHMPSGRRGQVAGARAPSPVWRRLDLTRLLDPAVLVRSLLLFNVLFALQTGMDVAYLWGGLRLPGNLSYAAYAHRGAYPLCFAAVLAAVFVLASSAAYKAAGPSGRLRALLLLWVGQNLFLLVSSALRLDLYVAAYSLTMLRVATFIWMGLVGLGLILITCKLVYGKTSAWLVGANALALGTTLYLCCFINFPLFIANYNVAHAFLPGVEGRSKLDQEYLVRLGRQAIPALDAAIEANRRQGRDTRYLDGARRAFAKELGRERKDWRAFGLESFGLNRYLDEKDGAEAGRPSNDTEH